MELTPKNVLTFLRESNHIEDQWDRGSLIMAHKAWKYLIMQDKLTLDVIKETHKILMKNKHIGSPENQTPIKKEFIGDFRNIPVWVGGSHKTLPKPVIESLLVDFCEDINKIEDNVILLHIQFENIHPFIDGNGRIGRMIMNWHNVKLKNQLICFYEKEKHIYYSLFSSGVNRNLIKEIEDR